MRTNQIKKRYISAHFITWHDSNALNDIHPILRLSILDLNDTHLNRTASSGLPFGLIRRSTRE